MPDDERAVESQTAIETQHAGDSAFEQAELHRSVADAMEEQVRFLLEAIAEHKKRARNYQRGGEGEQAVASRVERVIVDLGSTDWHLLSDRKWPGTRANLDLLLVGPPGVVIIDSKNWREPTIENGSLFNGQVCQDDELDGVRDQSESVAEALAEVGLAPAAVVPMLVLAGRRLEPIDVRGVTVVGERSVQQALIRLGQRLDGPAVALLVEALDNACPPRGSTPRSRHVQPRALEAPEPTAVQTEILSADDLWAELALSATHDSMESWMTWLHPLQAQLVNRVYAGPARIRGAAGTGKTVVALHRAQRLARRPGAHVLVTSFVSTVPKVQRALFERMAPRELDKVTFLSVHALASRILRLRGIASPEMAPADGQKLFQRCFSATSGHDILLRLNPTPDYWWDEVHYVLRGRGLNTVDEYLALPRVGRRTRMLDHHRRILWDAFIAYRAEMAAAGQGDYADLVDAALSSLQTQPWHEPFTSVIVDEVQDVSCQGLRLLHALVGDSEDGLLLVGDGQQAIYAGGFRLSEVGVSVPGARSTILRHNYRNSVEILEAALDIVSSDQFEDLDDDPEAGIRDVECVRRGGRVLNVKADDRASLIAALISALIYAERGGVSYADMALLVRTNHDAQRWVDELRLHGVPAILLKDYDGRSSLGVKVGTYHRAKGLEFTCVFVPNYESAVPGQRHGETADAYKERAELQRRQLFVAMTRARDRLWLGSIVPELTDGSAGSAR